MAEWYALKRGTAVVSYIDARPDTIPAGYTLAGPYASQDVARAALEPSVTIPNPATNLMNKTSSLYTIADLADFCKLIWTRINNL